MGGQEEFERAFLDSDKLLLFDGIMEQLRNHCPYLVGTLAKWVGVVRANANIDVATVKPTDALDERKIQRALLNLANILRVKSQGRMGKYVDLQLFLSFRWCRSSMFR